MYKDTNLHSAQFKTIIKKAVSENTQTLPFI